MTAGAYDTDPHPRCQLTTPILIDTDPGIDDALAILLALGSPEVSVEAITTVAGNVGVDLGTANAFRILDAARPRHRPRVARGAAGPLVGPLITPLSPAPIFPGAAAPESWAPPRGRDGGPPNPDPSHTFERGEGEILFL